ncbi:MAG: hypothetical protein KAS23_10700, partial [Anaerohalosphaera sp.]|nr:hypothetical protein [Anaerohalosphaera sp.]
ISNPEQNLYLKISDGTMEGSVNFSINPITTGSWSEVGIKISEFSQLGLDLSHVSSVSIGLNKIDTAGGGVIHVDDLCLYHTCLEGHRSLADFNSDCQIDLHDLALFTVNWLTGEYDVTGSTSISFTPVGHYDLNESSGQIAQDSSGNNFDATIVTTDPQVRSSTGGINQSGCIRLFKETTLEIPSDVFSGIIDQLTLSFWLKEDVGNTQKYDSMEFLIRDSLGTAKLKYTPMEASDTWFHCAFVFNGQADSLSFYKDGILVSQQNDVYLALDGTDAGVTSLRLDRYDYFIDSIVLLDELQVYLSVLSHEDIVALSRGAGNHVVQPLIRPQSDFDIHFDQMIDLKDLSDFASEYLQ